MTVRLDALTNGLRVVSDDMPGLRTASVGVWVDVGARHETAALNGVSHMLEHMAFKGTERRTARQIAEEIEAVGGHLNAYTSREQTAYYARLMTEDLDLGLDILADILRNSAFEADELERERGVIIQEIGQTNDTPDDVIFDRLQEIAYPDQAMGRSILGTVASVKALDRERVAGHMSANYAPQAMVLAAAGGVDHEALMARVDALFGDMTGAPGAAPEGARYGGGDWREEKPLEQAHLAFAFDGVAFDDADYYTAQVWSTVFGGGMSSRLFQEARERRGLCYSIFSFAASARDGGLVGVYAGTGEEEADELAQVVAGEMVKLADDAGEEETARARAQLKTGLVMSLESSASRCEQIARSVLIHGRVVPVDELIEKVDAVDADAVRRFGARVLDGARPAVAALGPVAGLAAPDALAARFG